MSELKDEVARVVMDCINQDVRDLKLILSVKPTTIWYEGERKTHIQFISGPPRFITDPAFVYLSDQDLIGTESGQVSEKEFELLTRYCAKYFLENFGRGDSWRKS